MHPSAPVIPPVSESGRPGRFVPPGGVISGIADYVHLERDSHSGLSLTVDDDTGLRLFRLGRIDCNGRLRKSRSRDKHQSKQRDILSIVHDCERLQAFGLWVGGRPKAQAAPLRLKKPHVPRHLLSVQ